ncbi:xin actin-binding repeat-containing protein 1 isoform 2-T2 [Thomomys bottae]
MATAGDQAPLPPPPPRAAFSQLQQQRRAGELRRLSRHIHPELRGPLAQAVAQDLATILGPEEDGEQPGQGDVQCMRWIFENWRLDAIGERDSPPPREPVAGGHVQAARGLFETQTPCAATGQTSPMEPSHAMTGQTSPMEPSHAMPGQTSPMEPSHAMTGQTSPMEPSHAVTGQTSPMDASSSMAVTGGDVQGTRKLFETRPLDRLGSSPSLQDRSPLELRSEIQELRGDVKKTVALFQTQPLCAIQDAQGGMHEVRAACREEIQSHAVRAARWLFETRPLDAFHQDPGQVRVIRGLSLEEVARPDVGAMQWIFETQPLDTIREVAVDEHQFQASPDLVLEGPGVRRQRQLFETRALDTLRGEENEEGGGEGDREEKAPPQEAIVPGHVQSTLWLFETQPLDDFTTRQVQVGELQKVEHLEGSPSAATPHTDVSKGDVKAFQHLFETLPLDRIGQEEFSPIPGNIPKAGTGGEMGSSQDQSAPLYAMQDSQGQLYALTSVSREQVLGGDVQSYRWMFETQPLDQIGENANMVDLVRGVTREEVRCGDVATARWLFETQPLATIHPQAEPEEGEKKEGPPPEVTPKGTVQTIRWLFETRPVSELSRGSGANPPSCTWLFHSPAQGWVNGSEEQQLEASLGQAGDGQTDRHLFDTEPLQTSCNPGNGGKGLVRCWSRVYLPSGRVSRHREIVQTLQPGQGEEEETSRTQGEASLTPPVCRFTWLFENNHVVPLVPEKNFLDGSEQDLGGAKETLEILQSRPGLLHHGGVLIEALGPGQLHLAKFRFPGLGHGDFTIQKEEVVSGQLAGVICQLCRRPDVAPQGLLVWGDSLNQLQLLHLQLPALGLHPNFQQPLTRSLDPCMVKMGLVLQETEGDLAAWLAYSLQLPMTGGTPKRRGVRLVASCINHGDPAELQHLRWKTPEDPTPVPAQKEIQNLPPKADVIQCPPLGSEGKLGFPESSPLTGDPQRKPRVDNSHPGLEEEKVKREKDTLKGPGTPDLQGAMHNLRAAMAEAKSMSQAVLNGHPPCRSPVVPAMPAQDEPRGHRLGPGAVGHPKIAAAPGER